MGLGLLDAAQAQKHVTVNEALLRLDALASRQVLASSLGEPPSEVADGDRFVVGTPANGAWVGQERRIAIRVNGGWEFAVPWPGLSLWDVAGSGWMLFDGTDWRAAVGALSSGGAASLSKVIEFEHVIEPGPTSETAAVIPDKAVVLGVTARVREMIGGTAAWSLGVASGPDRYGSGIGSASGAYAHGVSGTPLAYYGSTPLLLTAEGGSFTGGRVAIAIHLMEIVPPT